LIINPTTAASPPAERWVHQICEAARRVDCGECRALPGDDCVCTTAPASVPVTGNAPVRPVRGYHVARLCRGFRRGLISGPDLVAVLQATVVFTTATVIYDPAGADAWGGAR
jgi:hypothetical protein